MIKNEYLSLSQMVRQTLLASEYTQIWNRSTSYAYLIHKETKTYYSMNKKPSSVTPCINTAIINLNSFLCSFQILYINTI